MRRLTSLPLLLILTLAVPKAVSGQPPQANQSGNQYVAQALKALEGHVSIAAKLRQESRLYGQKIVGTGSYWQLRVQSNRVTRWEMQTQIGDQTASFVQVYNDNHNGNYLWTDRHLPSRRQVHRLDVAWLQARLREERRGVATDEREQLITASEVQGGAWATASRPAPQL